MNEQSYRLIRGKLHRADAKEPSGMKVFTVGSVFVPTDGELRDYRDHFEGPIDPKAPVAEKPKQQTVDERAAEDLKMQLPGIRDVVRQADADYLEVLQEAERSHQPAPRVKVMQMIERRLKSLHVAV